MASPFAPRSWAAHLLALVLVGAAGLLGWWQHDAWQAQRAAEARDLTRLEPVPLEDVLGPDDPFPGDKVGQPVRVTGTWLAEGTVLVSGREHEGREGYWVVTPLAVGSPDAPALPLVRGWTADPATVPTAPTGEADLVAWLQPTDGTTQADEDRTDDVVPQVRTADLIQHVDQDLYGAYGVVAPTDGAVGDGRAGLEEAALDQLPEPSRFTALRNLLYALEWWVFGAFAAFIWWRWVRETMLTGRGPVAEGTDEEEPADPVPSSP